MKKAIKSAESYGWIVKSSDAQRALDMWIEAVGEEQAYKDVVDTLSSDAIAESLAYIFRTNDFSEWNGEIESGCHGKSKKKGKKSVKSAFDSEDFFEIYPYSDNADPHSDEDLGLSAVIEVYGDEFVNVDNNTLSEMRDTLERYFDDEAYVRDWNINYPDDQIESIKDVSSVEDLSVNDLAMYFDYEAYGRDIRIGDGYHWDDEKNCWTNDPDVIGQSKKSLKSGIDFDEAEDAADIGYDDFKHDEHDNPFDPDEEPDLYDGWEVGYEKAKKESLNQSEKVNSNRKIRSSSTNHSRKFFEDVVKYAFSKYFKNTDLKYDPNKLILNEDCDEVMFAYDYDKSDPDEYEAMQQKIYYFEQYLKQYGISITEDDSTRM